MSAAPTFAARSGEISAHLFENPRMGVPRAIYWSCRIDFMPFTDSLGQAESDDEGWPCTLLCEWITWPIRDWRQIDGLTLANCVGAVELEASLYFFNVHQPLTSIELSFHRTIANRFRVRGRFVGDLADLEERVFQGASADFEVDIEFVGLAVVPENLFPKPGSAAQASEALSKHADLQAYEGPEQGDFSWLFRPRE